MCALLADWRCTPYGEEMGEKVTIDEVQEILEEVEDNIDSEMGVSWTTIRCGIEDLIKK